MATEYHQIFFNGIFSNYQKNLLIILLLSEHLEPEAFSSFEFYYAFYCSLKQKRMYSPTYFSYCPYSVEDFSVPTNFLPLLFLHLCKELQKFCSFTKILDTVLLSHFEYDFYPLSYNPLKEGSKYMETVIERLRKNI